VYDLFAEKGGIRTNSFDPVKPQSIIDIGLVIGDMQVLVASKETCWAISFKTLFRLKGK
jgi:hypothetical protein